MSTAVLADSAVADEVAPSPNHGERPPGTAVDILVLHYTQMASFAAALARLSDPASEVSAHYLVREDGHIAQLVPEARRAWHAGIGSWAGARDLNSRSIGIEIAHPGHAGGLPPYPEPQVAAVIGLAGDVVARHGIAPERVLGHSDIAPHRKEDPGETFPWDRLHAAGLGLWVPPAPIRPGPSLDPGDRGPEVARLRADLARYGYGLPPGDLYDDAARLVVTAFQRHFRPARVDGIADASTRETLAALLASLAAGA